MTLNEVSINLTALVSVLKQKAEEKELEVEERRSLKNDLALTLTVSEEMLPEFSNALSGFFERSFSAPLTYDEVADLIKKAPVGPILLSKSPIEKVMANLEIYSNTIPQVRVGVESSDKILLEKERFEEIVNLVYGYGNDSSIAPNALGNPGSAVVSSMDFLYFNSGIANLFITNVNINLYVSKGKADNTFDETKKKVENYFLEIGEKWRIGEKIYISHIGSGLITNGLTEDYKFILPSVNPNIQGSYCGKIGTMTIRELT